MTAYLKERVWEIILCAVASAALVVVFCQGFYVPDETADNFWLALLISAVIIFLAFLTGYNRAGMVIFPIAVAAAAAVGFLYLNASEIDIRDAEGSDTSIYIYAFAVFIVPLVVYLSTRRRVGVWVLMIVGSTFIGAMDYLHYEVRVWWLICFICCCPILFILQLYRARSLSGSTFSPQFGKQFRTGLAAVLLSLALAGGFYAGVIRTISPPTSDMEFLTKIIRWNIMDQTGITDQYTVLNEYLRAQTEQDTLLTDEKNEEEDTEAQEQEEQTEEEQDIGDNSGGGSGDESEYAAVSFQERIRDYIVLLVVLICAAVAAVPLTRRYLWKRMMKEAAALPPRDRAILLCRYYMKRFRRLGFGRPASMTELEYADNTHAVVDNFTEGTMALTAMMELYVRARYGHIPPTQEEDDALITFYPVFKQNYRRKKGVFVWLLHYLRL
ncbi:MAG: DUF4129 domain-containing protein [Lachnospiraceae bacterium]|nr:DUF4129 domain-containing protein [Lachnospiraceae bacterium]